MSSAYSKLARAARSIARRHAVINRARIVVFRLLREQDHDEACVRKVGEIGRELDSIIDRNDEWEDLREELLLFHAGSDEAFPPIPPALSRAALSVWLLTNLGLTAEEIGDVLFMTRRSVETQRYRMARGRGEENRGTDEGENR